MKRTLVLLVAAALTGCAGSPVNIGMQSPEELKSESAANLCNAYYYNKSENARAELERRKALTADEWNLADAKKIKMGMSELALVCSWGRPTDINSTTTRGGTTKQYVYRAYQGAKGQYVYVRNGQVTSWQQ